MAGASETNKLIRKIRKAGWTVCKTKKAHWKVTSPSGESVVLPSTPSEYRSMRNTRALLRRAGLEVTL